MKHFVKQKFYGKLFSFLKFKRHKKSRSFISFSKKKLDFNPGISWNSKKRQFVLKKIHPFYNISNSFFLNKNAPQIQSDFLLKMKQQNKNFSPLIINKSLFSSKETIKQKLIKKKYKINSFLFFMLCQYSRGRIKSILGKEFFTRYYTVPYRLSLSRFIGNKVLRSFYQNLNKKNWLNLRKKLTIETKRYNLTEDIHKKKPKKFLLLNKKEITRNLILNLENRLDSSLLRLFQFKPLYTKKFSSKENFSLGGGSIKRTLSLPANGLSSLRTDSTKQSHNINRWKTKSPWKNFSSLQIKQKINHGHIYINGNKVKSSNIQIKLNDKISIKGYISCGQNPLLKSKEQQNNNKKIKHINKDLSYTFNFRNSKKFLSDIFFLHENIPDLKQIPLNFQENDESFNINEFFLNLKRNKINPDSALPLLCSYIKHLKIKRFSEIFFLTYKNFFLLPDTCIFTKESFQSSQSPESPERCEDVNNLNFIFQNLGFNQSIYLLWPLINLISIKPWNTETKNNILLDSRVHQTLMTRTSGKNSTNFNKKYKFNKFGATEKNILEKNIKNLLNLKSLQKKSSKLENKQGCFDSEKSVQKPNNFLNELSYFGSRDFNKNNHPSWALVRAKSLNCYASFVYGTRKCKWIQLQQKKKNNFYNKIYNKINFYELELDFFQLVYRHYKNN